MASDEEAHELELLCDQYTELKAAVLSYQIDMERYVNMHAIEPPEGMKDQIWSALQTEDSGATQDSSANARVGKTVVFESTKDMKKGSSFNGLMAAAALVIIIASVGMNMYLWNKTQKTDQEVAALRSNQQKVLDANKNYQEQLAQSSNNIDLLLDPTVKSLVLAGVPGHTELNAVLLWNTKSKEVYLSLKDMPPPPSGKQYQLWAIVDGKPVDAGIYALNTSDAMQKMKVIPSAQMFAITIENAGGSPTPTLQQMVVAGKV
jgi:anti-sigma-K factor RskA